MRAHVNGSVGSHTTISPHHLHCVFSARRKGLQKFITNTKVARNPTKLLEQLVGKKELFLSLSAAGFLACSFFSFVFFFGGGGRGGIRANKPPGPEMSFVAFL